MGMVTGLRERGQEEFTGGKIGKDGRAGLQKGENGKRGREGYGKME
jgi:hypothetical protein